GAHRRRSRGSLLLRPGGGGREGRAARRRRAADPIRAAHVRGRAAGARRGADSPGRSAAPRTSRPGGHRLPGSGSALRIPLPHRPRPAGRVLRGGAFEERPGLGRVYRNPELAPADFAPHLRVLALDIETSLDGAQLYSVAMAGAGGERVLMVGRQAVAGAGGVPPRRAPPPGLLPPLPARGPAALPGGDGRRFVPRVLPPLRRRPRPP